MKALKKFLNSKVGRLALVALGLFVLALPALAEPFDFDDLEPEAKPTYEDLEIDCPSEGEEPTDEEKAACDEAVAGAFDSLMASEHPENHGKYVSFVAHCLKGVKGKGRYVRQIAQEKGDSQAELAVKLCAEAALADSGSEDDSDEDAELEEDASTEGKNKGKGKGKHKDSDDSGEVGDLDEQSAGSDEDSDDRKSKGKKGKGKGRRK